MVRASLHGTNGHAAKGDRKEVLALFAGNPVECFGPGLFNVPPADPL
jgi:hypothetical protein